MQCLGVPSCRRGSVNRSRELYLQEQSRKVAALNGQRLGKGCRGHRDPAAGDWDSSWNRTLLPLSLRLYMFILLRGCVFCVGVWGEYREIPTLS